MHKGEIVEKVERQEGLYATDDAKTSCAKP